MPLFNSYYNNLAKAIEVIYSFEKAIKIIENLNLKQEEKQKIKIKAGEGFATIETSEGLTFHNYKFDKEGNVLKANLFTPTIQKINQFKEDIKDLLSSNITLTKKTIEIEISRLINAYGFRN